MLIVSDLVVASFYFSLKCPLFFSPVCVFVGCVIFLDAGVFCVSMSPSSRGVT